jgi:hypothetical protein
VLTLLVTMSPEIRRDTVFAARPCTPPWSSAAWPPVEDAGPEVVTHLVATSRLASVLRSFPPASVSAEAKVPVLTDIRWSASPEQASEVMSWWGPGQKAGACPSPHEEHLGGRGVRDLGVDRL